MKKLLELSQCSELIKYVEEKDTWIRRDFSPINTSYFFQDISEVSFLYEKIKNYVEECTNFKLNRPGVGVLKYTIGDGFVRHIDRGIGSEFNKDFLYNINIVLNDDFEGGEFYLNDVHITNNKPGYIYHYKSTTFHEVKPVTKGTRYTVIFYLRERDIINTKDKLI